MVQRVAESTMDRESLVYKAKLAGQAERYDDMISIMKQVAHHAQELTSDERKLLNLAVKGAMGSRRTAWRAICADLETNPEKKSIIEDYKSMIETELIDISTSVQGLIDETILPYSTTSPEAHVFYYKIKGDCLRYLSEFKTGSAGSALDAYIAGSEVASKELLGAHPIRLGLALNYAVFSSEILNSPDKARQIAEEACKAAVQDLDQLDAESEKTARLSLKLLGQNLEMWEDELKWTGGRPSPADIGGPIMKNIPKMVSTVPAVKVGGVSEIDC